MASVPGLPAQRARLDRLMRRADILAQDLEERFIGSSGPGGQRVNKTETCVVLRHRPTGLEVRCQDERFQSANRYLAWCRLLEQLERRQRQQRQAEIHRLAAIRRRQRQKPAHVKARMVADKRHRTQKKTLRGRVAPE